MAIRRIDARTDDLQAQLAALRERLSPRGDLVSERGRQKTVEVFGQPLAPREVVERICREVREEGLAALARYSQQLDGDALTSDSLRVSSTRIDAAYDRADPEFLAAVRHIRDNVLEFQTALKPRDVVVVREGVELRQRFTPLQRVGVCVPGGAAAYPSSVLMTAVPAQAAGVAEVVVVAPPTPYGADNDDVLAVCRELGIDEVYRVGGAQAVAALAYGVEGMPPVDKIVGPGNLFVALAKQYVYGQVDIDSIAGPSEVVVVADEHAPVEFVAADLLAQAEHAPGSAVLVTWCEALFNAVGDVLDEQLAELERNEVTAQSLEQFGALILVPDSDSGCAVANALAPEHLHIATADADRLVELIPHAGAAFLGNYSPVAVGDYVAGPSHVLPTGGTVRWASGLTALDFFRSGSVIEYSPTALAAEAPYLKQLALREGLTAHWASVRRRLP